MEEKNPSGNTVKFSFIVYQFYYKQCAFFCPYKMICAASTEVSPACHACLFQKYTWCQCSLTKIHHNQKFLAFSVVSTIACQMVMLESH